MIKKVRASEIRAGNRLLGSVVSECRMNILRTIIFVTFTDGSYKALSVKQFVALEVNNA